MSNDYFESSHQNGKSGNDSAKIFVGGLARETTDEDLKNYFSSFGSVLECNLKRDFTTGLSRGFAFVTFEDPNAVDLVVAKSTHILGGKTIDPKKLKAKGAMEGCTKVFVGGVDPNLPECDIREYFQQYGKIESMDLPYDKEKNQRRGFCFINFESSDAVDMLCTKNKHPLGEREVDVKRATPQDQKHGGGAFRGGVRGGRGGEFGAAYGGGDWGMRGGRGGYQAPAMGGYQSYSGYGSYYGQQPAQSTYSAGGFGSTTGYSSSYGASNGYAADPYSGYSAAGTQKVGATNGKNMSSRGGFNDRYQPY